MNHKYTYPISQTTLMSLQNFKNAAAYTDKKEF